VRAQVITPVNRERCIPIMANKKEIRKQIASFDRNERPRSDSRAKAELARDQLAVEDDC
jgi:hypothetical protein